MNQRKNSTRLPAEWEKQDAVLLIWPSEKTDWNPVLSEVEQTYRKIAQEVISVQKLIVITDDLQRVKGFFGTSSPARIQFIESEYNDTWARDTSPLCLLTEEGFEVCDFGFNAWGGKFAFDKDAQLGLKIYQSGVFSSGVKYKNQNAFVFEGGAIDVNGHGLGITTANCLYDSNRNPNLSNKACKELVCESLKLAELLVLNHGSITGDDTDGHVDTLVRFVDEKTLVYANTDDKAYPAYEDLKKMQLELLQFQKKYPDLLLVPIPVATDVREELGGRHLPASYVNFLMINDKLLLPVYGSKYDLQVIELFRDLLPNRQVVPINCETLVGQNGSLHCITMQFPFGAVQ